MTTVCYILGSTRSGTSALRNAIWQTRFKGYGEGHIVPILRDLINSIDAHRQSGVGTKVPGNALYNIERDRLIRSLFAGYEQYLTEVLHSTYVIDKTPTIDPIKIASELNYFHRDAKFIFCSRRHVDNVASKIKKFPGGSFQSHCAEWTACNLAWRDAKGKLEGNYLEFDYHSLVNTPTEICQSIATYLELTNLEASRMLEYLISKRPDSSINSDNNGHLRLDQLHWSEEQKQDFLRICDPVGRLFGYGINTYFSESVLADGAPGCAAV